MVFFVLSWSILITMPVTPRTLPELGQSRREPRKDVYSMPG